MDTNICRVCLSNTADKDIKSLRIKGKNITYIEVLRFCLGIQIYNNVTSSKLCNKCYKKVRGFYKFKALALRNNSYFNKYISSKELKVVAVKLEHCDYVKNIFPNSREVEPDEYKPEILINGNEIEDRNDLGIVHNDNVGVTQDIGDVKPESEFDVNKIKKEDIEVKEDEHINHCNDDMLLSVMQKIKYEYVENESSEIAPLLKKTSKSKKYRTVGKEQVCVKCGKSVKNIKEHMQIHLPSNQRKVIKCRHCDKVFSTYGARLKHEKIKHFGKKFKCDQCEKTVVNLQAHVLTMHERSSLKFKCFMCDKAFLTKAYLAIHIVTNHTKERTFKCELCDKSFTQKITLNDHRRRVHEKEKSYMCQFCSRSFFKQYHLMVHIRSHTKEKPYNCKECGRAFGSVSVLKQHMTIHSEAKNYQCTLCDMSFARHNYLRRHMVSHTKEKNYPCRFCGVKFLRSDHRNRHEHTAHQKPLLSKTNVAVEPQAK